MKLFVATIVGLLFLITTSHAVVLNNVKINNNERITKETILTYGNIKLNRDYNQKQLNKIIKDLYETNFLKDFIRVDGQTLILDVEENKIIQSVKVEGVKSNKIKHNSKKFFSKDKSPF